MKNLKLKNSFRIIVLFCASSGLLGCKVANNKETAKTTSAIIGYFTTQQSAMSASIPYNSDYSMRDIWSYFFGRVYLTPAEASLGMAIQTPKGCMRSAAAEASFKINNVLDPGVLSLIGSGGQLDIPKYEEDLSFQLVGFLGFGALKLRSSGKGGTLDFEQGFNIPTAGSNLIVSSGTHLNQALPSPLVNASSVVRIQRSQGAELSFVAPVGATYVKATFGDTDNPDSNISCFGPPVSPLSIPAEQLERFGVTDRGSLRVDFVNISVRTDINRIKENLVSSSTFHLHGIHKNPFIRNTEFHFGQLSFE